MFRLNTITIPVNLAEHTRKEQNKQTKRGGETKYSELTTQTDYLRKWGFVPPFHQQGSVPPCNQ